MKWPLMTAARHAAEVSALKEAHAQEIAKLKEGHQRDRQYAAKRHAEEVEAVTAQVDDLIKRVAKVNLEYNTLLESACAPARFRVAVDVNPEFMMYAFVHGDSQRDLDMVAERIGREVQRELRSVNVWRAAEHGRYMSGRYDRL